jgi:hypothetical protein
VIIMLTVLALGWAVQLGFRSRRAGPGEDIPNP